MHATISVTAAVMCIAAICVIRLLSGTHLGKLAVPDLPKVQVILAITASVGLTGTKVGGWIHSVITWADTTTGGWIGSLTGATITGLLALALIALFVKNFLQDSADVKTLSLAAALPPAGTMVSGAIGSAVVTSTAFLAGLVGTAIGALFGQ